MERRGFWRESFAQSLEWFFGTMQPNIWRLMARRRSRLVSNTRNRWSMQPTIRVLALKPRRGTEVRSGIPFFEEGVRSLNNQFVSKVMNRIWYLMARRRRSRFVSNQRFESWLETKTRYGVHLFWRRCAFSEQWICFKGHELHSNASPPWRWAVPMTTNDDGDVGVRLEEESYLTNNPSPRCYSCIVVSGDGWVFEWYLGGLCV